MGASLPLSFLDVAQVAVSAGWSGWQVVNAVAVAKAESDHDAYAVGVVGHDPAALSYRSLDVGLFQINTYWWPTLKVADALDPQRNAAQAHRIWQAKFDELSGEPWSRRVAGAWSQWIVYRTGAHQRHVPAAYAAARTVGAVS